MRLRHFHQKEFTCNCGCGTMDMDITFLQNLDNARELAGIPFKITSGRRCKDHNRNIGGVDDSDHLYGVASDIEVYGESGRNRYLIVSSLILAGFDRIGVYKEFIHAGMSSSDTDNSPDVMWLES